MPSAATAPASPPSGRPGLRVHLALVAVQLIFGAFPVVGKVVMGGLPPLALAGLRVSLATPLLLAMAWRHDRKLPARSDWPMLILLGALGVFANQIFYILGLSHTTATNAAILMPSLPVITVIAAALLGVERVGRRRLLGIAFAVAGALVMVNPARFTAAPEMVLGNALLMTNTFCYAFFLVLQRPILARLPWRTVIAGAFLTGSLGVLVIAAPTLAHLDFAAISVKTWLGVGYIVVFSTVIAYSLNTWAIRRSSPALVAVYTTVQPLITGTLAAVFLGETFGWVEVAGFALIVAGLWQVNAAARRGGIGPPAPLTGDEAA